VYYNWIAHIPASQLVSQRASQPTNQPTNQPANQPAKTDNKTTNHVIIPPHHHYLSQTPELFLFVALSGFCFYFVSFINVTKLPVQFLSAVYFYHIILCHAQQIKDRYYMQQRIIF